MALSVPEDQAVARRHHSTSGLFLKGTHNVLFIWKMSVYVKMTLLTRNWPKRYRIQQVMPSVIGSGVMVTREAKRRLEVIAHVLMLNTDKDLRLDIDTTTVRAKKGDATFSYEAVRGYVPLLDITSDNGLMVGPQFVKDINHPKPGLRNLFRTASRTAQGTTNAS
jgi:hypothetical protein